MRDPLVSEKKNRISPAQMKSSRRACWTGSIFGPQVLGRGNSRRA